MEFQEWFETYEDDLNKEFADDNGIDFIQFCKNKYRDEQKQ